MDKKSKNPEIRFKGYTEDWEEKKLGEEIESSGYGPRFNCNDYNEFGNVKTIRGTDISVNGEILYDQVPVAILNDNFIKSHILEEGDLVMITTADCGLTGVYRKQNIPFIPSAYAVRLRLKKSSNPTLFKYYFQTKLAVNQVNSYIRKGTIGNLPGSDILKFNISIPSLSEQKQIGSFFQNLDNLITLHQKKYDKLVILKKAMLVKMFPEKGALVPEIRFKGYTGDWVEKELREISDSFSGGTPSVGIREFYNGDIPFIRSGEINSYSTALFITSKGLNHSSAKLVNKGCILYALYGATSGAVGISRINGAINQAILAIIPKKGYDSEFIMQWLKKEKQKIISTYLQGGQGNLSGGMVKDLLIAFPCPNEQQKIGKYFQNLDTQIDLHKTQLDKLNNIKKACFTKMFVAQD